MSAEGQLVIFELNGQRYGLPILEVQEIMRMVPVNPVPSASEYLEGVINLRGRVIPVLNLSRRLGLPGKERDGETRIIVVEQGGRKIGMIVDRVLEVGRYNEADIETPDVVGNTAGCLSGFAKKDGHILLLLNTGALCEKTELPEEPALDWAGAQKV